uniref:Uncharacterized protein n=1 Tax=Odontella aurita TaxID=265563 RepID=A0A7S4IJ29_9STRA|mmetsp:Transcript_2569/g.6691  ORF Transcript_2569/g.6691 Transcript_2569/m.6691 type:complete len:474 (+) Transcript_2569:141-1562(+)
MPRSLDLAHESVCVPPCSLFDSTRLLLLFPARAVDSYSPRFFPFPAQGSPVRVFRELSDIIMRIHNGTDISTAATTMADNADAAPGVRSRPPNGAAENSYSFAPPPQTAGDATTRQQLAIHGEIRRPGWPFVLRQILAASMAASLARFSRTTTLPLGLHQQQRRSDGLSLIVEWPKEYSRRRARRRPPERVVRCACALEEKEGIQKKAGGIELFLSRLNLANLCAQDRKALPVMSEEEETSDASIEAEHELPLKSNATKKIDEGATGKDNDVVLPAGWGRWLSSFLGIAAPKKTRSSIAMTEKEDGACCGDSKTTLREVLHGESFESDATEQSADKSASPTEPEQSSTRALMRQSGIGIQQITVVSNFPGDETPPAADGGPPATLLLESRSTASLGTLLRESGMGLGTVEAIEVAAGAIDVDADADDSSVESVDDIDMQPLKKRLRRRSTGSIMREIGLEVQGVDLVPNLISD